MRQAFADCANSVYLKFDYGVANSLCRACKNSARFGGLCVYPKGGDGVTNPRYANGALRRKYRARFKAMDGECGICAGRLGPIHYDEPSDAMHPLSFVIDEKRPVSRWRQFGYPSARAAAEDWNNLQPAHYCCNAMKGNRLEAGKTGAKKALFVKDGNW